MCPSKCRTALLAVFLWGPSTKERKTLLGSAHHLWPGRGWFRGPGGGGGGQKFCNLFSWWGRFFLVYFEGGGGIIFNALFCEIVFAKFHYAYYNCCESTTQTQRHVFKTCGGRKCSYSVMWRRFFSHVFSRRGGAFFVFAYRFAKPPPHPLAINNEYSLCTKQQWIAYDFQVDGFKGAIEID